MILYKNLSFACYTCYSTVLRLYAFFSVLLSVTGSVCYIPVTVPVTETRSLLTAVDRIRAFRCQQHTSSNCCNPQRERKTK